MPGTSARIFINYKCFLHADAQLPEEVSVRLFFTPEQPRKRIVIAWWSTDSES